MIQATAGSVCTWWVYEAIENPPCRHHIRDLLRHRKSPWILPVLAFGILNNSMTVAVFFQPKYKERLLPVMLRCYTTFNFIVFLAFSIYKLHVQISHDDHKDNLISVTCLFIVSLSQDMTFALLFLMSVVRLLFVAHPFLMAMCNRSKNLLICLVALWFAFRLAVNVMFIPYMRRRERTPPEQAENQSIYFITLQAASMSLNVTMYLVDKYRQKPKGKKDHVKKYSAGGLGIMYIYQVISSVLCLVTVLPYSILVLFPINTKQHSMCVYCKWYVHLYQNMENLFLVNFQVENLLYVALSKQYRHELKNLLAKVVRKRC